MAAEHQRIKAVPYRIYSCSSFSKEFTPARIIPNKPEDHTSRWSCQADDAQPWLLLELVKPAVLHEITIGKFKEDHPCNAQSLKILAGNDQSHLEEVLAINLKNDSTSEKAPLRHVTRTWRGEMSIPNLWDVKQETADIPFPVKFVKLIPGRAYEPRYNVSLWHIKFAGITEEAYIEEVQQGWFKAQRLLKDRLVLKHLRYSVDLRPAFQNVLELVRQSHGMSTVLEHPTVARLFDQMVVDRDYTASERTLQEMCEGGLMREYDDLVPRRYSWKLLQDVSMEQPSSRGGHAICAYDGTYWLFGGDDGTIELNDFWRGSLEGDSLSWIAVQRMSDSWPESKLQYCMTATQKSVYMIGHTKSETANIPINEPFGLVVEDLVEVVASTETSSRAESAQSAILWQFDIANEQWREISRLTLSCDESVTSLDWTDDRLFVGKLNHQGYSMAVYQVVTDTWSEIAPDPLLIKSSFRPKRAFSVDCFDPVNTRQIAMTTAATANRSQSQDDITIETIPTPNQLSFASGPSEIFVNPDGTSLILVTANNRECLIPFKDKQTSIYAYAIARGDWQELLMGDEFFPGIAESSAADTGSRAVRRCGHEMAYDRVSGRCVLYGGRTDEFGMQGNLSVELVLHSVREADILRKCRRLVRRQRFFDILSCRSALEALSFLQDGLSEVTDPSDSEEQRDLKTLSTVLLRESEHRTDTTEAADHHDRDRAHLAAFEQILHYVSPRYKEPEEEIMANMQL